MGNENSEKDKVFELERQLHEQYANNSNAHFKSFITFATAMFALFGAYGWAYIHTPRISSIRIDEWPVVFENQLSYDAFLLLAIVVVGSLCILSAICVFLGYAERRDQMEVRIIRDKYDFKTVYSTPFERDYFYYLASYYRIFYCALLCCQAFVILTSTIKCCPCCGTFSNIAYIVMAVFLVLSIYTKVKYFVNYKRYDAKHEGEKLYYENLNAVQLGKGYCIVTDGDKFVCLSKKDIENNKSLNAKIEKLNKERYIHNISYFLYCLNHPKCFVKYLFRFLLILISISFVLLLIFLWNKIIFGSI